MSGDPRSVAEPAATVTLAANRIRLRALVMPSQATGGQSPVPQFPRSRTLRWLMHSTAGRNLGLGVLAGLASRVPLGILIWTWFARRKVSGPA